MWYRKIESDKRHKKVNSELVGYKSPWWLDEDKGYFTYSKNGHSTRFSFYKNVSNRRIRHNKDYFSNKSNSYKKVFDFWYEMT